jgi:peptide deformylase
VKGLTILTYSLPMLELRSIALRQRCEPVPVDPPPPELSDFVAEMFACLYRSGGIGLAAPQVGVLWRLFVVDVQDASVAMPFVAINPELSPIGDEIELGREGCTSIPGYVSNRVPRFRKVRCVALDHRLRPFEMEAEGRLARVLQHEFDHLDGVLFTDRLDSRADLEAGFDVWRSKATKTLEKIGMANAQGSAERGGPELVVSPRHRE